MIEQHSSSSSHNSLRTAAIAASVAAGIGGGALIGSNLLHDPIQPPTSTEIYTPPNQAESDGKPDSAVSAVQDSYTEPSSTPYVITREHLKPFIRTSPAAAGERPDTPMSNKAEAKTVLPHEEPSQPTSLGPEAAIVAQDKYVALPEILIPAEPLPAPTELLKISTERNIPTAVAERQARDTAYIGGCSASLIRDDQQNPIGIKTAQHCNFLTKDGRIKPQPDGNLGIYLDRPFSVKTGDSMDSLSTVGTIQTMLVDVTNELSHDQVFGAFKGHSIDEVAAHNDQLSAEKIAALPKGADVYSSGWPVRQPNNPDVLKRQSFNMKVIGVDKIQVASGQTVDVLVTALPSSEDGTICSPGWSGSLGTTIIDGVIRDIGEATAYNDFSSAAMKEDPAKATRTRRYVESRYGVSMEGFDAVCSLSFVAPSVETGAQVLNVHTPEASRNIQDLYTEKFLDPNQPRNVIKGLVKVNNLKEPFYVENPAIYYDETSHSHVIVTNQNKPDAKNVYVDVLHGPNGLEDILIEQISLTEAPNTVVSTGGLHELNNSFVDSQGLAIGRLSTASGLRGLEYRLSYDNGSYVYTPSSLEGGSLLAETQLAHRKFNDPTYDKRIIDGIVAVATGGKDGDHTTYLERPVVFTSKVNGSTLLGYTSDNGLKVAYLYSPYNAVVYEQDDTKDGQIAIDHSIGVTQLVKDETLRTSGHFVDSLGKQFGGLLNQVDATTLGQPHKLTVQNGEITVEPLTPVTP